MYVSETYTVRKRGESRIAVFEMRYWRRPCRMKYRDIVRNEDVLKSVKKERTRYIHLIKRIKK